jgi:hypothetical protein
MFTELAFFQKAATSHCRDDTSGVEIPVSIPYQHIALLRFLLVLILACHWLACSLDLQKVFFLMLISRNWKPTWGSSLYRNYLAHSTWLPLVPLQQDVYRMSRLSRPILGVL